MKRFLLHTSSRVAFALLVTILAANSSNSQTRAELVAKYGEPQVSHVANGRRTKERYLVRPNILMTIRYTKNGRLLEATLDPVPSSTPTTLTAEHPPSGDYMATADVIEIINELVPADARGKSSGASWMNGGDREMKLNHPGCWGRYVEVFENVLISTSSWCWGGTYTASIQWIETKRRGKQVTIGKKR